MGANQQDGNPRSTMRVHNPGKSRRNNDQGKQKATGGIRNTDRIHNKLLRHKPEATIRKRDSKGGPLGLLDEELRDKVAQAAGRDNSKAAILRAEKRKLVLDDPRKDINVPDMQEPTKPGGTMRARKSPDKKHRRGIQHKVGEGEQTNKKQGQNSTNEIDEAQIRGPHGGRLHI